MEEMKQNSQVVDNDQGDPTRDINETGGDGQSDEKKKQNKAKKLYGTGSMSFCTLVVYLVIFAFSLSLLLG